MTEYIEREALIEELKRRDFLPVIVKHAIEAVPAADVAPVVHGRWEKSEDNYCSLNLVKCSVCHEEWCFEIDDDVKDLNYNYCPNCGARMDKEEE